VAAERVVRMAHIAAFVSLANWVIIASSAYSFACHVLALITGPWVCKAPPSHAGEV
jgi:hypothetical protein